MASFSLQAPKGTRDLDGQEVDAFSRLEDVSRRWFQLYRFAEVRTPIFESADLFQRSLGETSDVVEKEMFTFTDRGERSFSLRPEGTAGIVRYFLEHKLFVKAGLHRLFYIGPMFRAERPQAGRYRQFWQIGAEFFGESQASADADIVLMAGQILKDFGVADFTIQFNSLGCSSCRPKYRGVLQEYLSSKESILTDESKRRMKTNPFRVLDSKEDGPKLTDVPQMKDFLCDHCREHEHLFSTLVSDSGFRFVENPKLVRGLDYYTGVVFEITSPVLGAQNALAAGGRYDELVSSLGGPSTPSVGFALGMDRVVDAVLKQETAVSSHPSSRVCVVIPMCQSAQGPAFSIANQLRKDGFIVPPIQSFQKKLKNLLSWAGDIGAQWAVLIGDEEIKLNTVALKNLTNREQSQVPQSQLIGTLKGGRT